MPCQLAYRYEKPVNTMVLPKKPTMDFLKDLVKTGITHGLAQQLLNRIKGIPYIQADTILYRVNYLVYPAYHIKAGHPLKYPCIS